MSKILLLQGAKYSGKHRHKQVITMSFDECRDTYLWSMETLKNA